MHDTEKDIERISRLIARSVAGTLDDSGQAELDAWLASDDANRRMFDRMRDEGYLGTRYEEFRATENADGWRQMQQRMRSPKKKTTTLFRRVMRYAAVLAVGIAAGWGITTLATRDSNPVYSDIASISPGSSQAVLELEDGARISLSGGPQQPVPVLKKHGITTTETELVYSGDKKEAPRRKADIAMHTLSVPRGGEYKLVMGDGTVVWLNSESTLRYPVEFSGEQRRVIFEGEGYFAVAPDADKPFIVETHGVDITVLGTEFNVMSYPDSREIETTLVSGRVNIMTEGRNVALTPGRQAMYYRDSESIEVREVDTRIYTAWKDGVFEFDGMSLGVICKLLSRWYNVDIVFGDPQVEHLTFTGAARKNRSLAFILDLISDTRSIRYEMEGERIVLRMK